MRATTLKCEGNRARMPVSCEESLAVSRTLPKSLPGPPAGRGCLPPLLRRSPLYSVPFGSRVDSLVPQEAISRGLALASVN